MDVTELAELVRAGLDEDERLAIAARDEHTGVFATTGDAVWHNSSGDGVWTTPHGICVLVGPFGHLGDEVADHVVRHDPARVLAEVAAKRSLLDQALGWGHYEVEDAWYSCSAAPNAPAEHRGRPCDCGRDERVQAVIQALAAPYQEAGRG